MLDGAPFQHEIELARRRAGEPRHLIADCGVVGKVELAAPTIGPESERDRAVLGSGKDRAGIAEPDIAVAGGNELSRAGERALGGRFGLRTRHQEADMIGVPERAHERRHVAAGARKIAVPFVFIGRPSGPNGLLRRPFGRNGNDLHRGTIAHVVVPKVEPDRGRTEIGMFSSLSEAQTTPLSTRVA